MSGYDEPKTALAQLERDYELARRDGEAHAAAGGGGSIIGTFGFTPDLDEWVEGHKLLDDDKAS
jgi:hypothetical protein